MTDFISQYRAAFEAVGRPLTEADAICEEELKAAEQRLGHKLPKALRDFYRVAGNSNFLCNLYTLVNLINLQNQNGKLITLCDSDGGICDGIDLPPDSENPIVYSTNILLCLVGSLNKVSVLNTCCILFFTRLPSVISLL